MNRTVLRFLKKMTFLPQKVFLPFLYEYFTGKKLDLNNPIEFNQKIQWYKVYFHPKILNTLIDKIAVKEYVKSKIGEEYLNKTLATYNKVSEVNFDDLPNEFIIKATHTNRQNLIVKNKEELDFKKAKRKFKKWFSTNQYYRNGLEWGYKDIKPRLLVEKLMVEEGKNDLTDYKFYCFSGVPNHVEIHIDRGDSHKRANYDLNFNRLPFNKGKEIIKSVIDKPSNFEEMVTIATKLSKGFPFVRVDLYSVKGKTIFGELTFYPADGRKDFYPNKYNKVLGDLFVLPKIPKGQDKITEL